MALQFLFYKMSFYWLNAQIILPMEKPYIEEKTYEKIDFAITPFQNGEYENCSFIKG